MLACRIKPHNSHLCLSALLPSRDACEEAAWACPEEDHKARKGTYCRLNYLAPARYMIYKCRAGGFHILLGA